MDLVSASLDGGVAVLTLNDPDHRNVLSHAMSNAIAAAVAAVLADGARALVLAATPPVFCAGGSVDDLLNPPAPLSEAYAGMHALGECPVPTIAAVGGAAIGAGVSLPLVCDVVLVTGKASFDPRFLDVAIHPGGGHSWYLMQRVGYQGAAAMILCGETLSGRDAVAAGLSWRLVPDDQLLESAVSLAAGAARRPPALVARTKASLRSIRSVTTPGDAETIELNAQEWSVAQPEHVEAVKRLRARVQAMK